MLKWWEEALDRSGGGAINANARRKNERSAESPLLPPGARAASRRIVSSRPPVRSRAAATLGPSSPGVRGLDSPHHRRRAAALRTKRRRELFLATTKVEDFDRWWSVFSTTSLEKRKQHGSKGSHSFRDPNEEGRVWVLFDWDAEGWQNFISDPEVPAILQEAGHASRPQVAEPAGQLDG
jgi:hypothetical protein